MLISILIPNFNKGAYVQETLDSVLFQTYINWECIIVDDHSTDNSWKKIEEYVKMDSRFKAFKRPDNLQKGGNTCRNYALHLSKGDLILFLDSDDVLADFCLSQRILSALENPDFDFWAFPTALFEKKPSDARFYWNVDNSKETDLGRFFRMDALWQTSGCLYNRDFLIKVNGLSPGRQFWQDYELHLKALICSKSYRKFFHLSPDVFIRNGDSSSLSRSTPFTADFTILLKRISFLEEILTFAKIHNRGLTDLEFQSIFSFQYYLILQLWLRHRKLMLFWKKWNSYCKNYQIPIWIQLLGLIESFFLKLKINIGNKLRSSFENISVVPIYSILEKVQIGKHPIT